MPGTDSDGIQDKAVADAVSMVLPPIPLVDLQEPMQLPASRVALMLTEQMLAEAWPPRTGSQLPMVLHREFRSYRQCPGGADSVHPSVLTSSVDYLPHMFTAYLHRLRIASSYPAGSHRGLRESVRPRR